MTLVVPRQVARQIIKPIARQLIPSLGKKSLDIRAKVGTSTSPTSTGTKAVTGVGFQPKVVLPFSNFNAAAGADTNAYFGFGCKANAQAGIGVASDTVLTTSLTARRHDNSKSAMHMNGSGSLFTSLDITSLDSDGFTGSWVNNATARILNHICLGGADLEVSLVQCQMNGTNAAQSFAHGLSGAPTGVLAFGVVATTLPQTIGILYKSIGAWAGSNQFSASIYSNNGVTTTATSRILRTNSILDFHQLGSSFRSLAVSSVDATNVNITYPITVASTPWYFHLLCIRGAKCQVGTFNCNGSTSPLTITTTGITPKLFLPVFVPSGVLNAGSVLNTLMLSIGASDGTNNVSCGITDDNGQTTTNARRYQSSNTLVEYNQVAGKSFEATAAFSGQSVVLTPTTAVSAFGQAGYLILGS